jgi:hypothetical protein
VVTVFTEPIVVGAIASISVILSALPAIRLSAVATMVASNRNIGKRLEKRKRYAPLDFVLALLLTLIISPFAARSQRPTSVTIDLCVQEAGEIDRALQERQQVEARACASDVGIRNGRGLAI